MSKEGLQNINTTVHVTWSLRHPVVYPVKSCTVYYCQYITECTVSCYHVKGGLPGYLPIRE